MSTGMEVVRTRQHTGIVRKLLRDLGVDLWGCDDPRYPSYCVDTSRSPLAHAGAWFTYFNTTPEVFAEIRERLARLDREMVRSGLKEAAVSQRVIFMPAILRHVETHQPIDVVRRVLTGLGLCPAATNRGGKPYCVISWYHLTEPGGLHRPKYLFFDGTPEDMATVQATLARLDRCTAASGLHEATVRGARTIIEAAWRENEIRTSLGIDVVAALISRFSKPQAIDSDVYLIWCAPGSGTRRYPVVFPVAVRTTPEKAELLRLEIERLERVDAARKLREATVRGAQTVTRTLFDQGKVAGKLEEIQIEWHTPSNDGYAWAHDGRLMKMRRMVISGLTLPADTVRTMLDKELGTSVLRCYDLYSYVTEGSIAVTIVVHSRGNWTPTLFAFEADEDVITGIIQQLEREERRWTAVAMKEDMIRCRMLREGLAVEWIYTNQRFNEIQDVMRDLGFGLWRTSAGKQQSSPVDTRRVMIVSRDRLVDWFPIYADLTRDETELVRHRLDQLDRAAAQRELRP